MLSSESSSSDSESGTISQALPQRGTQRKRTYEPPQGAVLIGGPDSEGGIVETGEFDWNSIKDDKNIELWLVRIPNSIQPKHLNDAIFNAPSSSSTHTLGQVRRKHETYDLWCLGDRDENDVDRDQIGGDEMKSLSCLMPQKSKDGTLRLGPKPITRRLVLAASPPAPDTKNPAVLHQNPPRHSYPIEMFKHRYTPYGSSTVVPAPITSDPASVMDINEEEDLITTTQKPKKRSRLVDSQKKTTKKHKTGKP